MILCSCSIQIHILAYYIILIMSFTLINCLHNAAIPLVEHLPDPIPPDTLVDHLPNPIPPDTLPDILLDPIPPDILLDAQADSIAPAPPWGERRGDGDHYAPVPYVDPGGQQPEVIGALCGRGLNDLKRIVSVTFVF